MKRLDHYDLWERYKLHQDENAKDELIVLFYPLVRNHARKLLRKIPQILDYDDLVQSGMIGLIQALEKFELDRDIKFETFASRRINGSMLDDINKLDWTPRLVRGSIRTYLKALEIHQNESHEPPSDEELSEITLKNEKLRDLSPEDIREAREQSRKTYLGSVDAESNSESSTASKENVINSTAVLTPDDIYFQRSDTLAILKVIRDNLPEKHLQVIKMKYFEGKPLKEISKAMRLSSAQVALLHNDALSKIEKPLWQMRRTQDNS